MGLDGEDLFDREQPEALGSALIQGVAILFADLKDVKDDAVEALDVLILALGVLEKQVRFDVNRVNQLLRAQLHQHLHI